MPPVQRQCHLCRETEPPPKLCPGGCKKVWYCSDECRKYDRVRHIFDCNRSRPITTADHLALAVQQNLIPEHFQTCLDYGFATANIDTQVMLLGLYIGLLDPHRLGVNPYTLHKWRLKGTLVQNIKKEFEIWPENSRGGYYTWFLQNQDVVGGTPQNQPERVTQAQSPSSDVGELVHRAWCFIGRSPKISINEILRWQQTLPEDLRDCFYLYTILLGGLHPVPEVDPWITFGFCACESQAADEELVQQYLKLMHKTTFNDFSNAYKTSSLVCLFRDKGISITNPYILDVLSFPLDTSESPFGS